jgi:hypothetical protein
MKPNHHYAVHMPQQLRNFGPVYKFWTFLTEHLNKILKSYGSNFWGGGQLEISMMRSFNREVCVHNLVSFPSASIKYANFHIYRLYSYTCSRITKLPRYLLVDSFEKGAEDCGVVEATGTSNIANDGTYRSNK